MPDAPDTSATTSVPTAPTPEPAPAAQPRRDRWRRRLLWAAAVVVVLVLTLGVAAVIYAHNDADLERIHRAAAEHDLALTWADHDLPAPTPAQRAAWATIVRLIGEDGDGPLIAWKGSDAWYEAGSPQVVVGEPLPESLRAHHRELEEQRLAELEAAVDALGDQPIAWRDSYGIDVDLIEITQAVAVQNLLSERVLLAEEPAVAARSARRALAFAASLDDSVVILNLARMSLLWKAMQAIAWQLPTLQDSPAAASELARALQEQSDDLYARHVRGLQGDLINAYDVVMRLEDGSFLGDQAAGATGNPLVLRWVRGPALQWMVELAALASSHQDVASVLPEYQRVFREFEDSLAEGMIERSRQSLARLLVPAADAMVTLNGSGQAYLRVLAAELTGAPWPRDPFAADGGRLRAIVHEGRVVAAFASPDREVDVSWWSPREVLELYASPEHLREQGEVVEVVAAPER